MKKLLLSLAVLALGANLMSAADYVLFSSANYSTLTWTGDKDGYTTEVTVDGKKFTIETKKSKSTTNLIQPGDQIRVYKSSDLIITSNDVVMKQVTLTGMKGYSGAQSVSEGWTSTADDLITTLTNESGANNVTFSASDNQFRLVNLVVSDEIGGSSEPVEPAKPVEVNSVKDALAQNSGTSVTVNFPLTVAWVSNSNVFCCDAAGDFIQVYATNSYTVNDIIPAGWEAEYTLYSGTTPELTNATLPEATEKGSFSPKAVAAEDINVSLVNSVVLIKNVTFAEATPDTKDNFKGKVGDIELDFRNNYTLPGVAAGDYDVTVVVTVYQNAPSLYVINYAAAGSGVAEIEAEAAEAVYYNLQGVKVANPEKGLYIKVEGNKATKVVL
ncbi:MAG: hypothetical protein K2G53_02610 [Muribaculaceae bacterium]|nr:hypothetical protein [Muribaculaceae bacterium]